MKTISLKNMAVVLEVMVVFSVLFLSACENLLDKQEDIQKTTVTASAVINVPKGSASNIMYMKVTLYQFFLLHIFHITVSII